MLWRSVRTNIKQLFIRSEVVNIYSEIVKHVWKINEGMVSLHHDLCPMQTPFIILKRTMHIFYYYEYYSFSSKELGLTTNFHRLSAGESIAFISLTTCQPHRVALSSRVPRIKEMHDNSPSSYASARDSDHR